MPKKDLAGPEISCKHCQMTGKFVPPAVEGRVLDAQSYHLVLEPRLERINIDLIAVSLGEDLVGLPLLTAEKLIKSPVERDSPVFISLWFPECLRPYDDPSCLEFDIVPLMERAREWQGRPLNSIHALIYMDAVFLKMKLEGQVRNVVLYTIIGINLDGQKECLGP